jgi:hypothetical protein
MQQAPPHLDVTIKSYAQISQDYSEGQQSFWTECWYNFPCKIVDEDILHYYPLAKTQQKKGQVA